MFDTSIVRARAIAAPRSATLVASVAIHSIAIVAAVALTVTSTQLPSDPPKQFELYRPVPVPTVPPPPLGRPAQPHQAAQPPAQPRPAHVESMAPRTIPDEVHVVPPSAGTAVSLTPAATTTGGGTGPVGVPNGVDGGIEDGVPGGTGAVAAHGPYTPGVGGVTQPRVLVRVEPRFPQIMLNAGQSATVVVQCVIGTDGLIHDPTIVMSSFPPFNDAVLDALRQWKFAPGMMRGQAVDTYFQLTVHFEARR